MPLGRIGPAPAANFGIGILGLDDEFYFMRYPPTPGMIAPPIGFNMEDYVSFNVDKRPGGVLPPPGFHFATDVRQATFAERIQFPAQAVQVVAPRRLTYGELLDILKDQIVAHEPQLRERAYKYLQLNPTRAEEQTVCFMWKLRSEWNGPAKACTGGQPLSDSQREEIQANTQKDTTCAEEILLLSKGIAGWEFSLAYDMRNGWKAACQKGCAWLLERNSIADLYHKTRTFRDANAAYLRKRSMEYELKDLSAAK